ncbi:hypothetical protein [Bacillus fonticola]|uniref:hypothetical protein n=1 Tax=Bacillus fonticola TaxID=2728853 RepID=UPI0014730339|nr:hypothetical protein [Bacillus fonticola]
MWKKSLISTVILSFLLINAILWPSIMLDSSSPPAKSPLQEQKGTNDSLNEDEPLTVEEEDDIGDNDGRDKQNIIDQGTGETQDESPLEVLSIE